MRGSVLEALQARFLPEFHNRIDEVNDFQPLARDQINRIAELQVDHLAKLLVRQGMTLEVTPAALKELGNRGYDPAYGARPLKRVVQQQLQNPLAAELLRRTDVEGSKVTIDYDGDQFSFEFSS